MRLTIPCATMVLLCWGVAHGQIAPGGALSRAHAGLSGITQCGNCHDFAMQGFKCLNCHVEIRNRVQAGTGQHGRAYKSSVGQTDCARCHKEHQGLKSELIKLDRRNFDHRTETGFTLEGKHLYQQCEKCHNARRIPPAARPEIKVKDLNRSFLGLRRECTFCHQEPHQNELGTDCLKCHNQEAWKPVPGFNHSSTSFPLTGLHQEVKCEKCHSSPASGAAPEPQAVAGKAEGNPSQKLLAFKGVPFDGCQSCHNDPHRGAFQDVKPGSKCEGCHDTGGWKHNRPSRDFDHNLAKFRLTGKHAEESCAKCHKESDFRRPIAHELCRDCHEDPHRGQFAERAAGSDCAACHNTIGYKPSLFDREAHRNGAFPLEGKHSSLDCSKCHQPEGREARYITGKLSCPDCHEEPHGGELAAAPNSNKCDRCHTQDDFKATTFSIERHAQTKFPLTGKHVEVACVDCHKPLAPSTTRVVMEVATISPLAPTPAKPGGNAATDARRQYHFASLNCNACHTDPHEIDQQTDLTCETCHVTEQWKNLRPFNHSSTRFKLDGSHLDEKSRQAIACVKCHKANGQTAGIGGAYGAAHAPSFSQTPTQCSGCHSEKDEHGGQFTSPGRTPTDCSHCHVTAGWKGTDFDHDRARFTLSAAHRKTECGQCHKEQKEVNGKLVRLYRDTPADCLKCH